MLPCLTHSFPTRRSSDLPVTADLRPRAGEPLAPFLGRFGGNVGHGVSDAQTGARVSLPFAGPALDELGKGRISYRQIDHQGHQLIPSGRSEEHTSELQSLMRISYAVFCLKKKKNT